MKEKNNQKKQLILTIICILVLIIITVGVSYAFFVYNGIGTTENVLTTGVVNFNYIENPNADGSVIMITNALPTPDSVGRAQTGEGKVFDFRIKGDTTKSNTIVYEVTAEKLSLDSSLPDNYVKLYLTEVEANEIADGEGNATGVNGTDFENLPFTSFSGAVGKTLYVGSVPADSSDFVKNFRLRMWIREDANFSPEVDEFGNSVSGEALYNNQTFKIRVNVYATGQVITSSVTE